MRFILVAALLFISCPCFSSELGSISFYGDSITFRSGWNCEGLGLTTEQCLALKSESSYAAHVAYPYPYTTSPVFDVNVIDGIGGSTCAPRPAVNDPGMLARVTDFDETRIAVLIGLNDINLAGKTIPETITCIKAVWAKIADQFGARPVAVTYPPIDSATTVWMPGTSGALASANAAALNLAINQAASEFNATRPPNQWVHVVGFGNAYSAYPPAGNTVDGVHPTPQGATILARFFFWFFH